MVFVSTNARIISATFFMIFICFSSGFIVFNIMCFLCCRTEMYNNTRRDRQMSTDSKLGMEKESATTIHNALLDAIDWIQFGVVCREQPASTCFSGTRTHIVAMRPAMFRLACCTTCMACHAIGSACDCLMLHGDDVVLRVGLRLCYTTGGCNVTITAVLGLLIFCVFWNVFSVDRCSN